MLRFPALFVEAGFLRKKDLHRGDFLGYIPAGTYATVD